MNDDLPSRVKAAEDRARFRDLLDRSSLGDPDVKAHIEHSRRHSRALPDRWVQLREVDLRCLLDFYAVRREGLGENHETAVAHVLADVDFEPD
jgi:hypothetical protein